MGCRCDYVGITTAVPQIAADLLPLPKPAESGQSHRFGRTVTAAAYLQRADLSDQGSAIPSRAITGGADHECVWPTALTGNAACLLALGFWPLPNCRARANQSKSKAPLSARYAIEESPFLSGCLYVPAAQAVPRGVEPLISSLRRRDRQTDMWRRVR